MRTHDEIKLIRDSLLSKQPTKARLIDRYIKFIVTFENTHLTESYDVNHHILPRAKTLFPEYEDLKKYPWNSTRLSHRVHYIAHYILAKILGRGMWFAFNRMN